MTFKRPISIGLLIGLQILEAGILAPKQVSAQDCLDHQNDEVFLKHGEVYQNGKLRVRFDWWNSEQVAITSNAHGLDGRKILNEGEPDLNISDIELCPGVEIAMSCLYIPRYAWWFCRFSQF